MALGNAQLGLVNKKTAGSRLQLSTGTSFSKKPDRQTIYIHDKKLTFLIFDLFGEKKYLTDLLPNNLILESTRPNEFEYSKFEDKFYLNKKKINFEFKKFKYFYFIRKHMTNSLHLYDLTEQYFELMRLAICYKYKTLILKIYKEYSFLKIIWIEAPYPGAFKLFFK
ncbi:hypothetical protein BpHYR1_020629 [Brachionus plicatilis]|uniref:Uncharacterized protein n=1 Tax=Brachionus plicatilis TaxID=10195 RepID=A0A3M7RSU8_BRAPC|nr:hypothetical protein BpHYR1_020629 [Brachionus plicatilis]